MAISNKLRMCLLTAGMVVLAGCGSDNASKATPTVLQTTVKVFDTVANCKNKADVPSCHFDNGVYVIKLGNNVTDAQQQRVMERVKNMMQWAHQDVRDQFAAKRIIIGLLENESAITGTTGEFIIELNDQKGTIIDGIELIYIDNEGKDETLSSTTYQKLMQLYDYYVDGNANTATGTALGVAYGSFKDALLQTKVAAELQSLAYLKYDECNYGNGQLSTVASERALGTPTPCIDSEDSSNIIANGKPDETHSLAVNLNPGALLGTVYEYQVEADKNTAAGELSGSSHSKFIDAGKLGSGVADGLTDQSKLFVSWANPAFLPFKQYLDTYFFVNKK